MVSPVNNSEYRQVFTTLNTLQNQTFDDPVTRERAKISQNRKTRSKLSVYRAKETTVALKEGEKVHTYVSLNDLKSLPFIPEVKRGSIINIKA